jgi:dTDP-4-amino-4,6-dideoxygalactose transaminase
MSHNHYGKIAMNPPPITVPQANPGAGYRAHKAEIDAAVARVLASGWYVLGAEGRFFEAEFAAWMGVSSAIGVANGTDALALALRALDVGPGCAVATVSHTAVATVAAIQMVGATPVLIDIEPAHYTMDPAELADVLAHPPAGVAPIRAVIPVHLYGQPVDLEPIIATCGRHGVPVIEDCSQAHGATLGGRKLGSMTAVSCFSLYPTKNLGALGDGGVLATGDAALAKRLAALRQYGWHQHYISDEAGVNSRLDEMQAAILRVKLAHLDAGNARRQAIAAAYDAALTGALRPPARRQGATHVFHQYVLRSPQRADIQAKLREAGIGTGIHYPMPVHTQPAYAGRIAMGPAACQASAAACAEVFSLPMFPELSDAQVETVCAALRRLS